MPQTNNLCLHPDGLPAFNPERFTSKAVAFLRETVCDQGFSQCVIGVSGGVDSAVSLALCAKTLGAENVLPVLLPYNNLNPEGLENAKKMINNMQIPPSNIFCKDIKKIIDEVVEVDPLMDLVRKGNIITRVRMMIVFDLAKKHKALVAGTENKSEYLLGYFTRFGDSASDIEPIRSLYKTHVYMLARHLGIPRAIVQAPPTAGLWDGQTDENELGFLYTDADRILHYLYDRKFSLTRVVAKGFTRKLVLQVKLQVEKNAFKHHAPYVLV